MDTRSGWFRFTLWFALLGGAAAWSLHLLAVHVIAEFGCVASLAGVRFGNVTMVAWLIIAASAVMFTVAAAATVAGHWAGAMLRGEGAAADAHLAHLGLMTSGLFALVIAFQSLPIFLYLRHC